MISSAHVKVVLTKRYNKTTANELQMSHKMIETRKQHVWEKNAQLKMLVVYAIEKETKEIDLQFTRMSTFTF